MGKQEVVVVLVTGFACAIAAVVVYRHLIVERRQKRAEHILRRFGKQCATPVHKLLQLADVMVAEMRSGLASEGGSMLKMLISHVESLPTGDEQGVFYGVDLRGTNLHISRVLLGGKKARIIKQESAEVPILCNLMVGSSEELFDFVAKELLKFILTEDESFHVPDGRRKELGFTFSFPVDQNSGSSNTCIDWTKGFSINTVETPDMAAMHQDTSEDLDMVGEKMKDVLGIPFSTPTMREIVVAACRLAVERSARLAGAGIVAILKKTGRDGTKQRTVVAVDGGLYEHYRLHREYLHSGVTEMLGSEFAENVSIEHSNDNSSIGAALLSTSHS